MPCRPGFTPVAAEVHAGGVYVGTVEASVPHAPLSRSAARRGMAPASIIGSRRCHAAPSRPMTTAFGDIRSSLGLAPHVADDPARSSFVQTRGLDDRVAPGARLGGMEEDAAGVVQREAEVA